jgi:hypothetical protein
VCGPERRSSHEAHNGQYDDTDCDEVEPAPPVEPSRVKLDLTHVPRARAHRNLPYQKIIELRQSAKGFRNKDAARCGQILASLTSRYPWMEIGEKDGVRDGLAVLNAGVCTCDLETK